MAKILMLTPQLPYPPQQGTSLRNYNILRGLLINHEVDLLTFGPSDSTTLAHSNLAGCNELSVVPYPERTLRYRLVRLVTDRRPDIAHRLHSSAFDLELVRMLRNSSLNNRDPYDIVQVEGLELANAIPLIRKLSPTSRLVFDSHNAESELQRRSFQTDLSSPRRWPAAGYSFVQKGRLRKYEAWACATADWVTAVSEQDRAQLLEIAPTSTITVVPNCIDVADYAKKPEAIMIDISLVFTGKMDYRPNVDAVLWFADEIWPLINHQVPGVTWAIVGQQPHPRLRSLNSQSGITITGWVEEVLPYISAASVFIMPFRVGSGTRLKLIEAMAAGKAIVSTQVGVEGFVVQNKKQLLIADEPAAFARAVLSLLSSDTERERLGKAAQQHAQQYDWRQIVPKFDTIYRDLLD
jgi:glycosyltransferase involved in cell wall biosynthesis